MKQINNTIPMLQVKKWKYRETRRIAERYTAGKLKSQDLNLGNLVPDSTHFNFSENFLQFISLFFILSYYEGASKIISSIAIKYLYFQFQILTYVSIKGKKTYYLQFNFPETNRCLTKIHLLVCFQASPLRQARNHILSFFLFFLHPFGTRTNWSQRLTKFTLKYLSISCICLNFHHQKRN